MSLEGCQREHELPDAATGDTAVLGSMTREHVQGMALAIIDAGTIRYIAAHGARNAERKLPLTTQTIMYGASQTCCRAPCRRTPTMPISQAIVAGAR